MKQLAKGTELIAHEVILLRDRVRVLEKANKSLAKRRRAKRTRLKAGWALIIEDAHDLIAQKDSIRQQLGRRSTRGDASEAGLSALRCYGRCGKTGHNIRTYQESEQTSDEESCIKYS